MSNHFIEGSVPLAADDLFNDNVHGPGDLRAGDFGVDAGGLLSFGTRCVAINGQYPSFVRDEPGIVFATTPVTVEEVRLLPELVD